MSEEKIIVEINPDGSINAKTEGFKGEICLTKLEEILGDKMQDATIKKTDDYYSTESATVNQKIKRS